MKKLTIGKKEYTIEFTIEAALYDELTENIANLLMSISEAQEKKDTGEIIGSISNVPRTVLTMFYAGLLEHHGTDSGDGSIKSKEDAKKLVRKYFEENKGNENASFFGLFNLLIDCMDDDGFFNMIGLGQQTETSNQAIAKVPQDHKKKATEK